MNQTLRGFIKKELTQTLRDPRMRIVLFGVPLIQMTIFGLALSNEVKNIRLKFIHEPSDTLSRRIEQHCFSSGWFIPVKERQIDPVQWVQAGYADAVLVAPPGGLTKELERGHGRLQLIVDASNAIRARSIENYVQAIVLKQTQEFNPQLQKEMPLQMDVRVLFNPSMKTAVFMVPGVMCMILCLLTIILTSMSMAREKEMGTFETLISAPIKNWEVLLGKTLPYVFLGMLDVPLVLGVAMLGFGVPMRGEFWELALAAFVFVCTTVSTGVLISSYAKSQQQAMMGGFLFLFPAIQLSGVMAPLDNIPTFFKVITVFNPLRYFVVLLRNIMLKGGEPMVVWTNIGALVVLAVIAIMISARRFHKTLN